MSRAGVLGMTTKQADRLIGQEITVRWPTYNEQATIKIVARRPRSSIVEAEVKSTPNHVGVFNCQEFELVS